MRDQCFRLWGFGHVTLRRKTVCTRACNHNVRSCACVWVRARGDVFPAPVCLPGCLLEWACVCASVRSVACMCALGRAWLRPRTWWCARVRTRGGARICAPLSLPPPSLPVDVCSHAWARACLRAPAREDVGGRAKCTNVTRFVAVENFLWAESGGRNRSRSRASIFSLKCAKMLSELN